MEYSKLGNTGIKVSRLCFGALVMGPLQAGLDPIEGAEVMLEAFSRGVNFIDTAELYGTYPHIREALKRSKKDIVIATKCYAYTAKMARDSLEKARREMDLDVIDMFLLHEQETELTLKGHMEAMEYFLNAREKGIIKAVGASTHNVEVVNAICSMEYMDVVHPIINRAGLGIGDGTIEDMLSAVKRAYDSGKGIYGMKALGGGNLLGSYKECMKFVLDIPYVHSIAVGMRTKQEVEMNVKVFEGGEIEEDSENIQKGKSLHIDYWCDGCGNCAARCRQNAIRVDCGKAVPDMNKCVLCGYCASVCKNFAIKVV